MVGIALAFTLFAIVWPGMQVSILVLSGTLVAFAVFGLMTELMPETWYQLGTELSEPGCISLSLRTSKSASSCGSDLLSSFKTI